MRELYYAMFNKSAHNYLNPVIIEDGWEGEKVGIWLKEVLKQVKMNIIGDPTDEKKMADVASKIATVCSLTLVHCHAYESDTE